MAMFDIIEVTVQMTWLSQVCLNTYYYQVTGLTGEVGNQVHRMLDAWNIRHWEDATSHFRSALFSDGLNYTALRGRNLFDESEIFELLLGIHNGENTNQDCAPFTAFALRTDRTDGRIRRGQKRLPGVCEDTIASGTLVSPFDAALEALGEQLAEELMYATNGDSITFTPVVVGRIKEGTAPNFTYRLPETLAEAIWFEIGIWEPLPRVSTQNTRKVGRGV